MLGAEPLAVSESDVLDLLTETAAELRLLEDAETEAGRLRDLAEEGRLSPARRRRRR